MASHLDAGNLKIEIEDLELTSKVDALVNHARETGSMLEAMRAAYGSTSFRYPLGEGPKHLVVLYTDLEPDDILACAQILAWKADVNELGKEPIYISCFDFKHKDGGTVFEKKQLMASLALGDLNWHQLTFEGDEGDSRDYEGRLHPKTGDLAKARSAELDAICDELVKFDGSQIDFYVMAPGHGNIGAIVAQLKRRSQWPLKNRWQVSMYTGSFNTRGMTQDDLQALGEIMKCSDFPLVDMSKFPFFGGAECLKSTASLATFSKPDFVPKLLRSKPMFAAAWKSFNDEFNVGLVHPDNSSLFKGSPLTPDEFSRFAVLKEEFARTGVNAYARALMSDEGLWSKVVNYKKQTVATFAGNACDSPLCDQLLFFYEWLLKNDPSVLAGTTTGTWSLDPKTGFTKITDAEEAAEGILGIQPFLKDPKNEETLVRLQSAAEDYFFRHLRSLQHSVADAPVGKPRACCSTS